MSKEKETCYWSEHEHGYWQSTCGDAFAFDSGTPGENKFQFCPYCGRKMVEAPTLPASGEEGR